MTTYHRFRLLAGGLAGMLLAVACGGQTVGSGTSDKPPSSVNCVNADIEAADETCTTDADCTIALSGDVCGAECAVCPSVMNLSAATRIATELEAATYGSCGCPATPAGAICVSGQCTAGLRSTVGPTQGPDADVPPGISVSCAQVAHTLCTLANECTGSGPGGICMVVANRTTMCLTSVAACEQLFSDCELADGGTPGVFADPTQCNGLLDAGVCTQSGADMEFTLPPSCVTCSSASSFPGCTEVVDAG